MAAVPREPSSPPDFRAAYLRNPPPGYPAAARRNGEEGTVTLRVLVSAEGAPREVALERSSGSSLLDAAALATVKTWRFVPARRGGEAQEAWVLVPIVFRLEPRRLTAGRIRAAANAPRLSPAVCPGPGGCGRRVSGPLGPSFLEH